MKQADSIPTRRKLIQQSAALAATVPAALALPSMVAQAAEPDPIFDLIEAHKDAFLKWGGALSTEGDFHEKFASQHREELAEAAADDAKNKAWWDVQEARAKPVAEQLFASMSESALHRSMVFQAGRSAGAQ
jgi:hypothetical protein